MLLLNINKTHWTLGVSFVPFERLSSGGSDAIPFPPW
jgi:hypothetical protein